MKRKLALGSSVALSLILIAGCGATKQTNSANGGGASKSYKVGSLHFTYTIPQVKAIVDEEEKDAKQLGLQLISQDGQGDSHVQSTQAANLLTQKVNLLVTESIDPVGIVPVLKKYHDAGVPVIGATLPIAKEGQQYLTSFVGPDNIADGKSAAKLIQQALGDAGGEVVVIQGQPGTITVNERTLGFEEGLKGTKVKIVAEQAIAGWDRSKAMAAMQDFLSKYPNLSGVFAESDDMAMGAIQAIKQAGKLGKIKVVGHDGSKEGLDAIKSGDMYGTVTEPLLWEGKKAMEVAKDVLDGKKVEKWYKPPVDLLTKENVDSYNGAF